MSKEVETKHQARDAGNFNKLLIDKDALKPIVSLAGTIRTTHYDMTLPWGDNGDRLLPSKMYMDYTKQMRTLRDQFDAAVDDFVAQYPTFKQNARKRLGSMYDPDDYPDVNLIARKFSAGPPTFLPVPDAKDFRVDLGQDEVDTIRADITVQVAKQQEGAMRHLWMRLYEVTKNIQDRLADPETVFRDSLIDNARFATDIADKLNITEDKDLENIQTLIDFHLCQVAPQRLRDDKVLRKTVCDSAGKILREFPLWAHSRES